MRSAVDSHAAPLLLALDRRRGGGTARGDAVLAASISAATMLSRDAIACESRRLMLEGVTAGQQDSHEFGAFFWLPERLYIQTLLRSFGLRSNHFIFFGHHNACETLHVCGQVIALHYLATRMLEQPYIFQVILVAK